MFITTSIKPAGRDREGERRREEREPGRDRRKREEHTPTHERPGQRDSCAVPVGDGTAEGRDTCRGDDAGGEQQTELCVGEAEAALDVDHGDRPPAREEAEHNEGGGNRSERGAH